MTLTRRACDSDSTKMTRAHHCLLVTFVGTRNLNRLTDMCKFKSSPKDKSRPVGRFLQSFYSK